MKRSVLAVALVAGVTVGAAGAAVNAQEPAPAPAPVATATPAPIPVDPARARGLTRDGRYAPGWTQYRVHRARLVARVADPAGGPEWALRRFDAERLMVDRPSRSLAHAKVLGRVRCVQLVRVEGERFGWVYGDGRFHAGGIDDQLLRCSPRSKPESAADMLSTLEISDPAAPVLSGTVVWGLLPGAAQVTVTGSGAADGPAETSDGAFLRVAGPDAHAAGARVEGGGHTVRLGPSGEPPGFGKRIRFPSLVAGTATVEAPAPDPAGGPRWGVAVAQTKEGVPCAAGPTRVVDGRGGAVDLRLGVFKEMKLADSSCRPLNSLPSAEHPCDVGTGFGNAEEIEGVDEFLDRARVERRLLAGRATIWAQCGADVERVTLKTPRDVRTLTPSPIGHVILAVYDGDFVDGDLTITVHLKGGRSKTEDVPLGMF